MNLQSVDNGLTSKILSNRYNFNHIFFFLYFIAGFPQYLLYRSLGECLVQEAPPKSDCQSVLSVVWKYVTALKDPAKFMHCAEIWIQFTAIHFTVKELNLFLGEIINHLSPNRAFEQYYPQLQAIVEKIVSHTQDFESLLTMVRKIILKHN